LHISKQFEFRLHTLIKKLLTNIFLKGLTLYEKYVSGVISEDMRPKLTSINFQMIDFR